MQKNHPNQRVQTKGTESATPLRSLRLLQFNRQRFRQQRSQGGPGPAISLFFTLPYLTVQSPQPIENQGHNLRLPVWAAAILSALLAAGVFSACTTKPKPTPSAVAVTKVDDLAVKVREVVKDEARAAKVVALLEELQAIVAAQGEAVTAHDRQLKVLFADYGTTDAQLRDEFARFNAGRTERADRAIELVTQMRAATTPAEWAGLDRARKNALKAVSGAAEQE